MKVDFNRIQFDQSQDYLHYHNINNTELRSYIGKFEKEFTLKDGISSTIKSVINSGVKPYWMI